MIRVPCVPADPSGWPEHRLGSAGLDLAVRAPLGTRHTIAELGRRYELAVRLEPAATARASAVRPLDR